MEMAGHAHAHQDAHAAAPAETPPADTHQHSGPCDCLGSCHTPALLTSPQALIVAVAVEARPALRAAWPTIESSVPSRPVDRLPPQTAPPSA